VCHAQTAQLTEEIVMTTDALYSAVRRFAAAAHALSESTLNSNSWAYGAYEGVRYAFLHTTLDLRQLAARLQAERSRQGKAPTVAQHALAQHRGAFRDFEALLIGIDPESYRCQPSPQEWSINVIVAHVHDVERYFFAAILNALQNPQPEPLDDEATAAMAGEPLAIPTDLPPEQMWGDFARLHARVTDAFTGLTDAKLELRAPAWEAEPWPTVEFRMHRFDSHLREHTNQLEKVLALLDRRPNEPKMLLRQMYAALAEVEGYCIGDQGLGQAACQAMARQIDARLASIQATLPRIYAMRAAVASGDLASVEALLRDDPSLAYTVLDDGVSAILSAQYRGCRDVVAALLASGMRLTMAEAAAVGEIARVRRIGDAWPQAIDEAASDGFTPLQLACFFGHEEIAAYLLEKGANVHAVARNGMKIQPLHAAVAGQHTGIVRLLIAHGADVNARQQDEFTPLMAARQNNNGEIEAMLLEAGALA
jgi:uncharacterized protein